MYLKPILVSHKARRKLIMKYILLMTFCVYLAGTVRGQVRFSGQITDEKNKPLQLVSVVVLQDTSYVLGTTTNEKGNFQFTLQFTESKRYTLRISLVGYTPYITTFQPSDTVSLAHIILNEDKKTLGAVVVSAKKPLVERKVDRYVINVENSFLSSGNSGMEVLQKSPGVWVDHNGNIHIKGNQPVIVMINDVVQRMSQEELAEFLKSLKSEQISKIEIIPNPPAEFEAQGSGGIVHIILKKARQDGISALVYGRYLQQGSKPLMSGGISLDYKVKDFYVFGSFSLVKDKNSSYGNSFVTYPDSSLFTNYTNRNNNNTRYQYRVGTIYEISKMHSIGVQSMGTNNLLLQTFKSDITYEQTGQTITGMSNANWDRDNGFNSTTLNYSWKIDSLGSQLKVIADYTRNHKKEENSLVGDYTMPSMNSTLRTNTPSSTDIYSFQTDYIKVLRNKMELRSGVKYASIKRDNRILNENFKNNNWELDSAGSNHFLYDESILMMYASAGKTFNKTNIKAGLRGEQTNSKGNSITLGQTFSRNYFNLFPSIYILHTFNEKKGITGHLNYSRRLQRPAFNDLNPYRLQVHNFMILTGNPDLLPQYSHNFEVGGSIQRYTLNVYYTATKQPIGVLTTPLNNNILQSKSDNFTRGTEYGINLGLLVRILKIWNTNNSLSVYNAFKKINDFTIRQTSFSVKSIHTITLKGIMDIDAIGEYNSPYINSNSRMGRLLYFDMSFSRKFFKERANLKLYFADIFNTIYEKGITDYSNTHIYSYQKRPTRTVSISFSYNFKYGKKLSTKDIDQGNTEERKRMGN